MYTKEKKKEKISTGLFTATKEMGKLAYNSITWML